MTRVPIEPELNPWARRLEERRASGARLIDLTDANPCRAGLSPSASELAAALEGIGLGEYEPDPRGDPEARRAVARFLGAGRGLAIPADDLWLTASTSEAYAHLFRLLVEPGGAVAVPVPSYPLFEPLARLEGIEVVPYRLAYDGRWHLDDDSFERAVATDRVRAVIVVQPNHPTGSCLASEEIDRVEAICERRGLPIVSDEVFGDAPRPGRKRPLPSFLGRGRVPSFVLGGLSKSCGLPQWKVSWIVLQGPAREQQSARNGLDWIGDLFLSVSAPAQLALPRLLDGAPAFGERLEARLSESLAALDALSRRRPEAEVLAADGGWSAVLRLPAKRSGEEWALELLERDGVVHPGHFYDMEGEAYLIVSLIPGAPDRVQGIDRLETLLAAG